MLPPLRIVSAGLRRTTETLAAELGRDAAVSEEPSWSEAEWRLAMAVAVAHGVSPLLSRLSAWRHAPWRKFLDTQREHVRVRHARIAALLSDIDVQARAAGIGLVALKGAALHAQGEYAAGERPMADIDLLVRERDQPAAKALLERLGYVESFAQWKHRVFKPVAGEATPGFGEHRDTPVNIELHARIQERLPIATIDITHLVQPRACESGLNAYPSRGALMSHLLLHAAGNLCGRSLRLIHLHDIARLARRMDAQDWDLLCGAPAAAGWAWPPLFLAARYYGDVAPAGVMARLEAACPRLLRIVARRQTLTDVSCSALWLQAFGGIEWSRSAREALRYVEQRIRPSAEARQERADMIRTQVWLRGQSWVRLAQRRRVLAWLAQRRPRMDTLYVVRAAFEQTPG